MSYRGNDDRKGWEGRGIDRNKPGAFTKNWDKANTDSMYGRSHYGVSDAAGLAKVECDYDEPAADPQELVDSANPQGTRCTVGNTPFSRGEVKPVHFKSGGNR